MEASVDPLFRGPDWKPITPKRGSFLHADSHWTAFLRKLARRGLRGVKLVISDAHEGIKAAVAKVLNASWQRCRVHFMRNVLAHAGRQGRRVVSAFIATAFAQDDAETATAQGWRPRRASAA
jgi:transposase-like protein